MRKGYEVFLLITLGKEQWDFIGIQMSSKNKARQIVVCCALKEALAFFITMSYLDVG